LNEVTLLLRCYFLYEAKASKFQPVAKAVSELGTFSLIDVRSVGGSIIARDFKNLSDLVILW